MYEKRGLNKKPLTAFGLDALILLAAVHWVTPRVPDVSGENACRRR